MLDRRYLTGMSLDLFRNRQARLEDLRGKRRLSNILKDWSLCRIVEYYLTEYLIICCKNDPILEF